MSWFSSEKKDEGEQKYHIIRKMHVFHVFPNTEYLTRIVALFFLLQKLDEGADENQDSFFHSLRYTYVTIRV